MPCLKFGFGYVVKMQNYFPGDVEIPFPAVGGASKKLALEKLLEASKGMQDSLITYDHRANLRPIQKTDPDRDVIKWNNKCGTF